MSLKDIKPIHRQDNILAGKGTRSTDYGREAFFLAFKPVLVGDPAPMEFAGSIKTSEMQAIWTWIIRDVMPEIKQSLDGVSDIFSAQEIILPLLPEIFTKTSNVALSSSANPQDERHLIAQLGSEEIKNRLPVILNILRCQPLLAKAVKFGQTANGLRDDELGAALKSLPLKEVKVSSLLFHALVGEVKDPSSLILAASGILGGAGEAVLKGGGFEPLIDAILSHAQDQISIVAAQSGHFGDVDLICKTIKRYHHLMRAVTGYVEVSRSSNWYKISADLTKQMGRLIEPRLNDISFNVTNSLRKERTGIDKLDADMLLNALNGIYLLVALREARETLALNAIFEKTWKETGQNLETLIDRNMETYKLDPANAIISQRLDMGIKMAEVRLGKEYSSALFNAKEAVSRRQKKAV